jgi:hypothetical protein
MRYGTLANVRFGQCALLFRFAVKKIYGPAAAGFYARGLWWYAGDKAYSLILVLLGLQQ